MGKYVEFRYKDITYLSIKQRAVIYIKIHGIHTISCKWSIDSERIQENKM